MATARVIGPALSNLPVPFERPPQPRCQSVVEASPGVQTLEALFNSNSSYWTVVNTVLTFGHFYVPAHAMIPNFNFYRGLR